MRTVLGVIFLLLVGLAVVGFYQGWFLFSTESTGGTSSATVVMDQNKIIDSEVANEPHSATNTAVPSGVVGFLPAERFISNLEINHVAPIDGWQAQRCALSEGRGEDCSSELAYTNTDTNDFDLTKGN